MSILIMDKNKIKFMLLATGLLPVKTSTDYSLECRAYDLAAEYDFCNKREKAKVYRAILDALRWARDVK